MAEMRPSGRITDGMRIDWSALRDSALSPLTHPPGIAQPRTAWVPLLFAKWGMTASMGCEWGEKDQTADNVVFQFPIHRSPRGLHLRAWLRLTVLGDETIDWLLNTCPDI